jgi:hypothetical protein
MAMTKRFRGDIKLWGLKHDEMLELDLAGVSAEEIGRRFGLKKRWVNEIRASKTYREKKQVRLDEIEKMPRTALLRHRLDHILNAEAESSIRKLVELRDTAKDGGVQLRACQELLDRAKVSQGEVGGRGGMSVNIAIGDGVMRVLAKVLEGRPGGAGGDGIEPGGTGDAEEGGA